MRRAIRQCVEVFANTFAPQGLIVEIGSYFVPGSAALCDLRPVFRGIDFVGCDIRAGSGVDRIEDAHDLSFASGSVGTVLMLEVLEHLPNPARAVDEAFRVLRPDGVLAVSVPFTYRLHGFPNDYWRFTASGIDEVLAAFPSRVVVAIGPRLKPAFIFAVAAREGRVGFPDERRAFLSAAEAALRLSRARGHWSAFKERGRDFFGLLIGRAELQMAVFDPSAGGGYRDAGPVTGAVRRSGIGPSKNRSDVR